MRRFVFAFGAVLAFAVLANPANAQLKFGGHVAMISGISDVTELDGEFGVGARLGFDLPALPIGVYGSATYFFPDCDDCSYYTASLGAKLGLPLPVVQPYLHGGFQRRATSFGAFDESNTGAFIGLGVSFSKLFVEGAMEFNSDDPAAVLSLPDDPIVFKGGFLIG